MNSNELFHIGTPQLFDNDPHGSGRFRQGTGENPYQHGGGFRARVAEMRKQGLSQTEIAKGLGMTTTELRERITIEKAQETEARRAEAIRLKDKGYSNVAAAKMMGMSESSFRYLLRPIDEDRNAALKNTTDILRENVDSKGFIDVGKGVELEMNVARTKFNSALRQLKDEGYVVHNIQIDQLGAMGNKTTVQVLCPPGTEWKEVAQNKDKITTITNYLSDDGLTKLGLRPVQSISSKRVQIRYAEDGGTDKDGVIELRRGVEDISLGESHYAQVRIGVDDSHYLKGMAVYSDNMPDGIDIIFNTNKSKSVPMMGDGDSVLKKMKKTADGTVDLDNPFGATIKPKGQHGCINMVNDEGDWGGWKKSLASQMLSKQPQSLIKRQLDIAYLGRESEYNDIKNLTNPEVKRYLLDRFASQCESDAVHLKAAALPRQASQVILPLTSLKDNEVYAPNYKNGEQVVLIRYPHGGIFEIPQLRVNNNNLEGRRVITNNAKDAIGINSRVAERLSGADFDGDSVLVIPVNDQVRIRTAPPLEKLKDFNPREEYRGYEGMKVISSTQKQREMGNVSNLITDMTLKGASSEEISRAVRHSMVVIDAEKHKLDWKRSYEENGIAELKKKYQGGENRGASTLISRAKSPVRIPERSKYAKVDPETGKMIFKETGRTYQKPVKKNGEFVKDENGKWVTKEMPRLTKLSAMEYTDDAFTLSSGTPQEALYANYANKLKALANSSRKEAMATKSIPYSKTAKEVYSKEVESLQNKLNIALRNAPRERQAQIIANSVIKSKKRDNPDMDKEQVRKYQLQALSTARNRLGATSRKDRNIKIEPREWEAIQAGAVKKTTLNDILKNSDLDYIKELATPRESKNKMTQSKINRAKSMARMGYTNEQISDILGVSPSTVSEALNKGGAYGD